MPKYRQVALDTETTGLKWREDDRIIEVGCVEMVNRKLTGKTFSFRCDPQHPIHPDATKVHGITDNDVRGLKTFAAHATDLFEFIDGADLIMFNAPFDEGFLNVELKTAPIRKSQEIETGKTQFIRKASGQCTLRSLVGKIIDVLPMARRRWPRSKNTLDAVCDRLNVDRSGRTIHGAVLDAKLTALCWLAITHVNLDLPFPDFKQEVRPVDRTKVGPLKVIEATDKEVDAHLDMLEFIEGDPFNVSKTIE